jgi:hypothetical protein
MNVMCMVKCIDNGYPFFMIIVKLMVETMSKAKWSNAIKTIYNDQLRFNFDLIPSSQLVVKI